MARPMLLVQEPILSDMWAKHNQEVPILALIRQENLPITSPTLAVLFGYMTAMEQAEQARQEDVYQTIYDSLFPEWLTVEEERPVVQQPRGWYYSGKMPLGKWNRREGYPGPWGTDVSEQCNCGKPRRKGFETCLSCELGVL